MHARTIDRHRPHRPLVALASALVIALAGLGWSAASSPAMAQDSPALFDSSTVHDIAIAYDAAAYDAMIATYKETGDKDWIEATVTIDGATYEDAGIRLKGNSSLMSLRGGRGGFGGRGVPGPAGPDAAVPGASTTPAAPADPVASVGPAASAVPAPIDRQGFGGPGFNQASADEPERLPWLIRLDRNVDDQNHQGITELVVRSNNSQTSLNEAVALELLEAAGLASQQAAPTAFRVNDGAPVLRLIIEHPNDEWQTASFGGDGALYKAESTGDWSYRGDDPEAYTEIFDQEAGKDVTDLAPLMAFLQFINEADAATFAAELPERFDVDAFAAYLAMMDLVGNFDDVDGPGNNAYLHWDAATGMFTIVPWDMNLAFGGMGGGRGPGGFGGFGGGRPPGGGQPPEGFQPIGPDASLNPALGPDRQRPGGFGPGGRNRSNPLVDKFHADAGFEALYQEQLTTLRAALFEGGVAQGILDTWAGVLTAEATGLVDAPTIAQEFGVHRGDVHRTVSTAAARILVVDDEENIRFLVGSALRRAGFEIVSAATGRAALDLVSSARPDLVVLDVMLPDLDGFAILDQLRRDGSTVPVIFLTARDATADRVRGLTSGGTDYQVKPFAVAELVARVRLRLDGHRGSASALLRCADLELDPDAHRVTRGGETVHLSPTEYKLLHHLLLNTGRVLTREQILDHVWDYDYEGDSSVVDTYISYLRRKVDVREPRLIHTVRGVGFALRADP